MYQTHLARIVAAFAFAAGMCWTLQAHAHINMSGALMSRGGDEKNFPCDGTRGAGPVYTFEPGSTITLSVNEVIPHPSYFRITFDDAGEDAFVEPKSIKPIDPTRACPFDANDKCDAADYCNVKSASGGPTVLWDNLNPHLAGATKTYTWNVKLPNVECDSCVIQVLQIMEDTVHGAYCPTGSCTDFSAEDIYHRCIDIQLKKGATNSPGTTTAPVNNQGIDCVQMAGGAPTAGTGSVGTSGTGGGAPATAGATAIAGTTATAGGNAGAGVPIAGNPGGVPTGAAGASKPGAAGSTGGTGTGVVQGSTPGVAPPSGGKSGCSVVSGRSAGSASAGWLLLLLAAALTFMRRRSALQG
jgi:MYXO-CTERM domain-containing protein